MNPLVSMENHAVPSNTIKHINLSRSRKFVILAYLVAVATTSVSFVMYHVPLTHAYRLASSHLQEPYSELYFADHRSLPSSAPVGIPVEFSFVIGNHQSSSLTYQYKVDITTNGVSKTISTGTAVLDNNARTSKTVRFTNTVPSTVSTITVSLLGRNEHISFRLES